MAAPLLLSTLFVASAHAAKNGLAVTPQMGWNTWNAFGCSTSQDLLLSTASTIKKIGLQDVGYHYIVQDDCWSAGRDSSGALKWDTGKFPSGIPYVAQQMHNQGFGFGIYSDAGTATCGGYAGSLGHEQQDAKTWASWGVDYLKYDNCNNNGQAGSQQASSSRYQAMASALSSSGRAILYSICNWGQDSPWVWGPAMGNSWRISGDIRDNFNTVTSACGVPNYGGYNCPVTSIIQQVTKIATYGAPGGWNDMDMLEIGNGGMTDSEYVVHFSMWAAAKSPLIMGNAMSKLIAADYSILANAPVIAVSQDPLGIPATQKWVNGNTQLWSGQLASTTGGTKDQLVVLLNLNSNTATVTASLSDIFGGSPPASNWEIRDLWGSRLSNSQAQTILSNGAAGSASLLYNSTATSYSTGLAQADPKLLGTSIGSVATGGSVSESVPGLGCRVLRLRATSGSTTGTGGTTTAQPTTSSSGGVTTTAPSGSSQTHYGQCGGQGWQGPTSCQSPYTCQVSNQYYSQCL